MYSNEDDSSTNSQFTIDYDSKHSLVDVSARFDEQNLTVAKSIPFETRNTAPNQNRTETEQPTPAKSSTCTAVENIIFIKTHKTASSTVQNILFRYGSTHDLTFALPANNGNRFSYPAFFKASMVKQLDKPFNIITNHLRASQELHKGESQINISDS